MRARPGAWMWACVCVRVALLIQHATRMRYIVFSFVASGSTKSFDTILQMAQFSKEKKGTKHKMCVLVFPTNLPTAIHILRRIQGDFAINMKNIHVKYVLFLLDFHEI